MAKEGRGRLSSLRLLPREVSHIVQWASSELQDLRRTQVDIYQEFVAKLEAAKAERRGELEFTIPSFSSFNRYSVEVDADARELAEAREMARAVADSLDEQESDDLTLIAAENLKALVYKLSRRLREGIDPKGLNQLSSALHRILQAQDISTERRQKVQAEVASKAKEAVNSAVKSRGLSAETADAILTQILGVEKQ